MSPFAFTGDAEKNHELLNKLFMDENPFLAMTACRVMASSDQLEDAAFRLAIHSPDPVRQGILARIAIKFGARDARPERLKQLVKASQDADRFQQVRGIALALLVSEVHQDPDLKPETRKPMLDAVEEKLAHEQNATDYDKYLILMAHATEASPAHRRSR